MPQPAITVNNVSKRYRIGQEERADTLAGQLRNILSYPVRNLRNIVRLNTFREGTDDPSVFWALQDINFEVQEGEVLGIIGHNGAGKSTLLKILSRITEPTTGEILIRGRVSSLLEVGTGFHQELTGRDNVYMNGTILGMTKKEIDRKFDEIVDFSGIAQHIDTPVKFYSSGMKVRLAFAVAAHLDPEILIIDEVLAVGDLAFQQKCLGKMNNISNSGRTILFVSHNMGPVEGLCDRALMLDHGNIVYSGSVDEAIRRYRADMFEDNSHIDLEQRTDREGVGDFRFTKVVFNQGEPVIVDQPLQIDLHYHSEKPINNIHVALKFSRNYREVITTIDSKAQGALLNVDMGEGILTVRLPKVSLMPNTYVIDLWAGITGTVQDRIFNVTQLTITPSDVYDTGNIPDPKKHGLLVAPKCEWYQNSYA